MKFSDLGLSDDILRAVADAGYTTPTPIQSKAIPYVLMNRDVLGCAQTGTGKTASFTLPMIEILSHGRARARSHHDPYLAGAQSCDLADRAPDGRPDLDDRTLTPHGSAGPDGERGR